MKTWPARAGLIAVSIAFVGLALPFMRRLGIEADEAMVANGIFDHGQPWYSWRFGQFEIPVMLISYLGALKSWLLNPYFALWRPSPVSLRFPAVLTGVVALWLFFAFLDRVAGRRGAWIGTLLLATDSAFLLIETTDFGFVALQFVLKLSAILLLLRFHRNANLAALAAGFFLFGVALWDKAVFAWVLCGLAAGTAIVFPRILWRHLTLRNLATAAASIIVGALPLLIYNIERPLETWRTNVHVLREPVLAKAQILFRTMDGSALFGFVTSGAAGPWSHNLILPALAAALLASVIFWRRSAGRAVLFGLIACCVTWLLMAMTAGAGGAVQHTILLWPFHLMIIVIAIAQLPLRWAVAATIVLCASNLAVTGRYYTDLMENGPAIRWSDAMEPLERYLTTSRAERIFIADWGIVETLSLLSQGSLPVYSADVQDSAMLDRIILSSGDLVVAHTPGFTFDSRIREQLETRARKIGRVPQQVAVIADSNQRPTFEIFRFGEVR
jgi:hypothetical protein